MGLFQRAIETYETHIHYTENKADVVPMAPVGHIVVQSNLEITLDSDGQFVIAAVVEKTEPKILIPATEGSAGRTSAPCAHPLCEQLGYLLPRNEEKYNLYVKQLTDWVNSEYSHAKLKPILQYVSGGSILEDLLRCHCIKLNPNGIPENEKLMIRWRIQGENPEECWKDATLFEAFTGYYLNQPDTDTGLCLVTGEDVRIATQHPKGVFSLNGNAKLISSNDKDGFTYRGRFTEDWQAAQIGYVATQKAHNALRWLIDEQGKIFGGRVILCWNPQGKTITLPTLPFRSSEGTKIWQPDSYRKELRETLESRKRNFEIQDGVVVAAFDAATTGRLSLTYYNEFQAHDFLQRLHDWDNTCCWTDYRFGIRSPELYKIVQCAFGTQKTEKGKTRLTVDDRIMRQQMQSLVACRVEKAAIGADFVRSLVSRASQPQAYDRDVREDILFTACAVIRKYRYDRLKEDWSMALEPEKKDRSYQFGRLLAVLEKVERDTYNSNEDREPNAIRMQSVFCQRPMYALKIIESKLEQAYFPRLSPGIRGWYKSMISQIMECISQYPQQEWDNPLEDSYLMGYYLQRNELYKKKNGNTEECENECAE